MYACMHAFSLPLPVDICMHAQHLHHASIRPSSHPCIPLSIHHLTITATHSRHHVAKPSVASPKSNAFEATFVLDSARNFKLEALNRTVASPMP